MIETVLNSENYPISERLDWWNEVCSRLLVPCEVNYDGADGFCSRLGLLDLGGITVATISYPSLRSRRTSRHVRQSDPELYQFAVALDGRHTFSQERRHVCLDAGDLLLYDTSHPNDSQAFADERGRAGVLVVNVPRKVMSLPPAKVDSLMATRIPGDTGVGALLSRFLTGLVRTTDSYRPLDAGRLGVVALDLITATLAHHLDAPAPHSPRQALIAAIYSYIEHNLGAPGLDPPAVAAAHHISVRYLHLLFQQQDTTVSSWIRHRRLERCRHDLAEPLLDHRPIGAIAMRWGFTSSAEFSRSFRSTYGLRPSEYRADVRGCRPER
ncbi:helix-turn-helix domain-containing protein [Micromonospora lupini]|nr:helix-turn-helix domain-containing protein [Micromonospora lupini]